MRTKKFRSAMVIISRVLPGIKFLFCSQKKCQGFFEMSSPLGLRGGDATFALCVAASACPPT